jgi:hypothetical protein
LNSVSLNYVRRNSKGEKHCHFSAPLAPLLGGTVQRVQCFVVPLPKYQKDRTQRIFIPSRVMQRLRIPGRLKLSYRNKYNKLHKIYNMIDNW